MCANINAILIDNTHSNLLVIGDFNCRPDEVGGRFYNILNHMLVDNNLIMTGMLMLQTAFTYCSDSGHILLGSIMSSLAMLFISV